jgi:hypothetical protein
VYSQAVKSIAGVIGRLRLNHLDAFGVGPMPTRGRWRRCHRRLDLQQSFR